MVEALLQLDSFDSAVTDHRSVAGLLHPGWLPSFAEALALDAASSKQVAPAPVPGSPWSPGSPMEPILSEGKSLFPVLLLSAEPCPGLDLGAYMIQW